MTRDDDGWLDVSVRSQSEKHLVQVAMPVECFGPRLLPSGVLLPSPVPFMAILQLLHEQLEEAIFLRSVKFRATHVFRKLAVAHLLYLLVHALNASVEHWASEEGLDHLTLWQRVRNHLSSM